MVAIVMPVYQGEAFLAHQIESILGQSYPQISLYIRDDGSTDSSRKIVSCFAEKDARIKVMDSNGQHLGVTGSIKAILRHVKESVVFFADQDDIWSRHKISTMLEHMPDNGLGSIPVVVFSDLEVVDENLESITGSFWEVSGIDPHKLKFIDIIRRNCVTGCACMINKAMLEKMTAMPDKAVHDWWTACVAAKLGIIIPLSRSLVQYRQHGGNKIGMQAGGLKKLSRLLNDESFRTKFSEQMLNSINHLLAVRVYFSQKMNISEYIGIHWELLRRYFFYVVTKR